MKETEPGDSNDAVRDLGNWVRSRDYAAGIERLFKFIQMLATAAVVQLLVSIRHPRPANLVGFALCFLASFYLLWPPCAALRRWYLGHPKRRYRSHGSMVASLVIGALSIGIAVPVERLFTHTVKVDVPEVRRQLVRENAADRAAQREAGIAAERERQKCLAAGNDYLRCAPPSEAMLSAVGAQRFAEEARLAQERQRRESISRRQLGSGAEQARPRSAPLTN